MPYEYIQSEPRLWTVGFYDPNGKWRPESDHDSRSEASSRAELLNGSNAEFCYIRTESSLWTVGTYNGKSFWADSDHDSKESAAATVIELNS